MAETIWKIYEVIHPGCDHHPDEGNGPDTIFLVRAENPEQAAETSDTGFEKTVTYGVSYGKSLSYAEAAVKLSPVGVVVTVPAGKVVLP